MANALSPSPGGLRLRPVLKLHHLVFHGLIVIMPIAALPLFGIAQQLSHGFAVTTLLIGMVTMMFTAVSYGRMAAVYPSAGSAYDYIGRTFSPQLGFLGGWAMLLMYLAIPLSCVIYGSLTMARFVSVVPYAVWALVFAALMTGLNLIGIRATARTDLILLVFMCVVVGAFILLAVRFLWHAQGWAGLVSARPFYRAGDFDLNAILVGTSFSAFTFIGFDSPTTMAEDVEDPRRTVLLATVLVCLITGLFSGLQVYLGQRVWPGYLNLAHPDTAFMDISRVVGGAALFAAMGAIFVVANLGSGLGAQACVARLLFSMGRDNVLPRRWFGAVDLRRSTPVFNLLLVGSIIFLGALAMNYELTGEVLNFGAFTVFVGVNLAALWHFHGAGRPAPRPRRPWARWWPWFGDTCAPVLGLLLCVWIWWHLKTVPKLLGAGWMAAGAIYLWRRGGRATGMAMGGDGAEQTSDVDGGATHGWNGAWPLGEIAGPGAGGATGLPEPSSADPGAGG